MKLCKIKINNFRNIDFIELNPAENINIIYGDNAQGKTNLIEAIWIFTGNQSFRGNKTSELIKIGEEFSRLEIEFESAKRKEKAEMVISKKKKATLNGVEQKSASKLKGSFYSVVFSPDHLSLIKEGPKERRDFLDIAISHINPKYENYLSIYNRLLEQRNSLLKNSFKYGDLKENMSVWDSQLAKAGTIISIYRKDYINRLSEKAAALYDGISHQKEKLTMKYASTVFESLEAIKLYGDDELEKYQAKLSESFENDLRQGFTTVGIHRDDIEFEIEGKSAKIYGSQGQQRSAVIVLKLSEAAILHDTVDEMPVMLLDDIMSELDSERQHYILNNLKQAQVFITCCDKTSLKLLDDGRVFEIENGGLKSGCNSKTS